MTVAVADAPPFGLAFLAVDFAQGFTTVLGADVLLGVTPALQLLPAGPMLGSGAGGGYSSLSLSLPANSSLSGLPVYMQWFVLGGNLSATEGIEAVLF